MRVSVIDWDGREVPAGLSQLPPGRYVVEPLDEPVVLSAREEDGIIEALDDLDSGKGIPAAEVMASLRKQFPK